MLKTGNVRAMLELSGIDRYRIEEVLWNVRKTDVVVMNPENRNPEQKVFLNTITMARLK